ncbi:von Willebrand factor type A domain-containing protein [Candidatus Zixiibacteriota bacterium]|nr:von Willebrand factor type A domain-containing protein [candidate division Zixibacteria bacterium]
MRSSNSKAKFPTLFFSFILLVFFQSALSGEIKGRVTDAGDGSPVRGASINIVGFKSGAITDNDGRYRIMNVPSGTFILRATALEYEQCEIKDIVLKDKGITIVDFQLKRTVSELGKVIKVEAEREAVNKYSPQNMVKLDADATRTSPDEKNGTIRRKVAPVPSTASPNFFAPQCINPPGQKVAPYPNYPYGPSTGGNTPVNGQPYDAMFFKSYGTNPFIDTEDDPLSTFAADVDDASFVMARAYLKDGNLPPDEAIRTEEFINHFKYDYAPPDNGPFNVDAEGAPYPFGRKSILLKIGIKGREIDVESRKPANLIFVIDVSGSMATGGRLEMVKDALRILVDNLFEDDRIGIVAYSTSAWKVLPPTSVYYRHEILSAIESLHPTNSTNAEAGLRLGYELADRIFDRDRINRLILCSDGVANVGNTSADDMLQWIKGYAERGIFLTAVGFGISNYNDILLEQLGDKGNGNYYYVNSRVDARKIFLENLNGTLQVIAKDVKIQVSFDPATVASYRLLGYENRDVADEQFRNDRVDGGEIGAGHQVTALYEIKLRPGRTSPHIADLNIRFKHPNASQAGEFQYSLTTRYIRNDFDNASADFKIAAAAAQFAEILRKSYWAKDARLSDVQAVVREVMRERHTSEISELLDMIQNAERLENRVVNRDLD